MLIIPCNRFYWPYKVIELLFFIVLISSNLEASTQTDKQIHLFDSKSISSLGTLIVAVPVREGLVICADKRLHNRLGDEDNIIKIRVVDDYLIYAASGLVSLKSGGLLPVTNESNEIFNVYNVIENAISLPDLYAPPSKMTPVQQSNGMWEFVMAKPNLDMWETIAYALQTQMNLITSNLSNPNTEIPQNSENRILEVRLFYIGTDSKMREFVIVANYNRLTSFIQGVEIKYGYQVDDLSLSLPIFSGSPEVFYELKNGTRKEFDQARKNSYIKPFLRKPRPREKVSQKEAINFSRELIRVTSSLGNKLNEDIHVSEICDCGVLANSGGFTWVSESYDNTFISKIKSFFEYFK